MTGLALLRNANTRVGLVALAALAALFPTLALAEGGTETVAPNAAGDIAYAAMPAEIAPGFLETSEFMIGTVAVGVIFVESNGAIDPDEQDWTDAQRSHALSQIRMALDAWETQEPKAHLSFVTQVKSVAISYEPIKRSTSSQDQALWIGEAMKGLGYPEDASLYRNWQDPYVGAVYEYANALRRQEKTDWAFVVFAVNDARDADGKFSDGNFAYARLGGPYMVVTYRNDGWTPARMNKVVAHEMGHVFYATDQYDGKTERSGYYNTVDIDGTRNSLMNGDDTFNLTEDTRLQIGWRDSDGDGILDPVDTTPVLSLEAKYGASPIDQTTLTYRGVAQDKPLANQNSQGTGKPVTINRVTGVRYRLDGGAWRDAAAGDGAFNSVAEDFTFTLNGVSTGAHLVEVTTANSVNNGPSDPARDTILVTHIVVDQAQAQATYANVGSQQPVRLHMVWAHDASPVRSGTVTVDGTSYTIQNDGWVTALVSSMKAGVFRPQVTAALSGAVRRFSLLAPMPAIGWDRIRAASVKVSDSYVGVGTSVTVWVKAETEDSKKALGVNDKLFVGGRQAVWDGEAKAFRVDLTEDVVTTRTLSLTSALASATGITAVDPSPLAGIIWDRVSVTETFPSRQHTDVGATESIFVRAVLEQSGLPLGPGDAVSVNGQAATWDAGAQAFRLAYTGRAVGRVAFTATHARQATEDVAALAAAPETAVVWDQVQVTLVPAQARVDVGTPATVQVAAVYAYDGTPLEGDVTLGGPLQRDVVGWGEVTAVSVRDLRHGLAAFSSNVARIAWDRLEVTLTPVLPRVEVGGQAVITAVGRYASDGAPADVEITLDSPLSQVAIGPWTFRAAQAHDLTTGLTAFTSNSATVIFDRIEATHEAGTVLPGRARLSGTLRYASDGASVEGAKVWSESGEGETSTGAYAVAGTAWLPWTELTVTVQAPGFQAVTSTVRSVHYGNAAIATGIVLGLTAVGLVLWRRRGG